MGEPFSIKGYRMAKLGFSHQLAYCTQLGRHGMGLENPFSINERVEWDVKGVNARTEHGIIKLIVRPKDNPAREMKKHWGSSKGLKKWRKRDVVKNFYVYIVEHELKGVTVYTVMQIFKLRKSET